MIPIPGFGASRFGAYRLLRSVEEAHRMAAVLATTQEFVLTSVGFLG